MSARTYLLFILCSSTGAGAVEPSFDAQPAAMVSGPAPTSSNLSTPSDEPPEEDELPPEERRPKPVPVIYRRLETRGVTVDLEQASPRVRATVLQTQFIERLKSLGFTVSSADLRMHQGAFILNIGLNAQSALTSAQRLFPEGSTHAGLKFHLRLVPAMSGRSREQKRQRESRVAQFESLRQITVKPPLVDVPLVKWFPDESNDPTSFATELESWGGTTLVRPNQLELDHTEILRVGHRLVDLLESAGHFVTARSVRSLNGALHLGVGLDDPVAVEALSRFFLSRRFENLPVIIGFVPRPFAAPRDHQMSKPQPCEKSLTTQTLGEVSAVQSQSLVRE